MILSYTNQNEFCSPDNGIDNVVGVKVEDPDTDHEEDQVITKGIIKELTKESHVKDAFFSQEVLIYVIEQARFRMARWHDGPMARCPDGTMATFLELTTTRPWFRTITTCCWAC